MGAFNNYILSGKYKLWKIENNPGKPGVISPRKTDKVEPVAILDITVVDGVPPYSQNYHWYVYLYDFVKYGKTTKKIQYIKPSDTSLTNLNPFYDPSLEERLGGTKERLGG